MRIDLNVDIGEGFELDEALLAFASSANVCCGAHAGSREMTSRTVELCIQKDIRIGAHPGYPDRPALGRADALPEQETQYRASLAEQVDWFVSEFPCAYIKPHGAWYNAISRSDRFAVDALEAVLGRHDLPVMLLPSANPAGCRLIREGFADRAYLADGRLMPRSQPGAVLHDPELITAQVLRLAPQVDSICLHGDTANALEFAELVTRTLTDHGYEVGW